MERLGIDTRGGKKNTFRSIVNEIIARENLDDSTFEEQYSKIMFHLVAERNRWVHLKENDDLDYSISELADKCLENLHVLYYLAFNRNTGARQITWGSEEDRKQLQGRVVQAQHDLLEILAWAQKAEKAADSAE